MKTARLPFRLNPRNWGVGTKITTFSIALVGTLLLVLLMLINRSTATLLEERTQASVSSVLSGVNTTLEVFNSAMTHEAGKYASRFAAEFDGPFALDASSTVEIGGKPTPTLKNGNKTLNLDFALADRFTSQTGAVATVFAASGEEFVRVTTSLKKENGERAVGTQLDHTHPSYVQLRAGKRYIGLATLFGKQYITQYDPVKDAAGQVVGVLFIGLDITSNMAVLKERINALTVGKTGYVFVLNAAPGKNLGTALIHPNKEGSNLLEIQSSDGRYFIKEMLEAKVGTMRYSWARNDKEAPREKLAVFNTFKEWNWLVAGGTYTDEITAEAEQIRNHYALLGMAAMVLFAGALLWLVHRYVTVPLKRAEVAAARIAAGDLDVTIAIDHKDEIGLVLRALNRISANLSGVVGQVRQGAEHIAATSNEIASGNHDLSSRTEEQAASLEQTAAAMEQLHTAVRQNADNAVQANLLVQQASGIADQGGKVVAEVVDTMDAIDAASRKIVDIISVIDGIAFQTNILALNAAVEAARAGDQGRGFAVVATEVRNLAQRSATAAKEIKVLINDSVEKIANGSKQVAQAGSTMNDVVASVARVTGIMGDIRNACEEQRAGIGQVHQTITQMDQMTQQNAALVEEAAASAQALQDQADELAQVVQIFNLGRPEARAGRHQLALVTALPLRQAQLQHEAPVARPARAKARA